MMGVPDQKVARDWIFKNYPQIRHFDNFEHPIYVVAYETKARDQIGYRMITSTVLLGIELFTFFFLLHWNMKKAIRNMTLSPKTLATHSAFLKAINMQIAIPAGVISTPQVLLMVLGYVDYSSPEINSIGYMLMSIHGASSTLIMLYCHTPYRQFCQSLVGGRLKIFRHHKTSMTVT
ncbi:hypothetical protein GCK72_019681 [Caenorhabditis remanei]|uniref:Uncharacterized protein n=1 Tax=Caenorhabditis remanei TaxID=31234 RepID=A0A6A5GEL0_CAERE|nr:hypothetical protein GCK72_019681 [Caenorhabditis remanei]KAF1753125.1 hypothetical protein GCK72_019681 [Caenorhabditis remanei]